jgi:hypothetical protein
MSNIDQARHVQFSNSIEIHKTEDEDDLDSNQSRPLIRRLKNERPNSYSSIEVLISKKLLKSPDKAILLFSQAIKKWSKRIAR